MDDKVKTITFFNIKGGVGKTTLTVNTASKLVHLHPHAPKTLIIDLDAQASATNYVFGPSSQEDFEKSGWTVYEMVSELVESYGEGRVDVTRYARRAPEEWGRGLYLVPGSYSIMELEKEVFAGLGTWLLLMRRITSLLASHGFKYVFIDPPASFGVLSRMALAASTYFIVPVVPDELGRGSLKLLNTKAFNTLVFELRSTGLSWEELPLCGGVVFNKIKTGSSTHVKIAEKLSHEIEGRRLYGKYKMPVYKTMLGNYVVYTKSLERHLPLFKLRSLSSNDKKAVNQFNEYFGEFYRYVVEDEARRLAVG